MRRNTSTGEVQWTVRRNLDAPGAGWVALAIGVRIGRRLGVQFRRQVPLAGRFIIDFAAPSVRLVVAVDGASHIHRRAADMRRDRALAYRVLRLDAALVMSDLAAAVALVTQALV